MKVLSCALGVFAVSTAVCVQNNPAIAQQNAAVQSLPDIVVTAGRTEESLGRTGSAITVVHEADLAKSNPRSLVDALRAVPGLDITETGGPGATTTVRLRGANNGQTLVLVDGIRVGDPTQVDTGFDFALFPAGTIERIEVLRGPQSALYGSDAIGGVVNIITKKGSGPAQVSTQVEGGSYGTASSSGSVIGAHGPWSYSFAGGAQKSDGFSRYGYRIPWLEARFPPFERDGFERYAGTARLGYDTGEGVRIEAGAIGTKLRADYDAAFGAFPDTPSVTHQWFGQVWARAAVDTGPLTHDLKVYANRTDRSFNDVSFRTNMLPQNTTSTISDFIGDRTGTEYQGNLKLGAFGTLIAGAKTEQEKAATFSETLLPTPVARSQTLAAQRETNSFFGLWNLPVGDRLILSFGGRVDDVLNVDRFQTWRTTAAYLIPETGTKLRASAGTGGKAPSLFQLFDPTFGNPGLKSERSLGWDAGIDQNIAGDRVTVSLTAFGNKFRDLIDFVFDAGHPNGHYLNVARAKSEGVELGSSAELWPRLLRLTVAYTFLRAKDEDTGFFLARRPQHAARLALTITPNERWTVEPRLYAVSERFSSANEANRVSSYARLDLYTDYKIDQTWTAFARMENVTDTRYQEVANFGTSGRALYGGVNAKW